MRICYLGDGESIHTKKWVGFFADKRHKVHLFSGNMPSGRALMQLGTVRILPYLLILVLDLLRLRMFVRAFKPDVVHAHTVGIYSLLGTLLDFHPFVITAWGSDILVAPRKFKMHRWIVKYIFKSADLITCDAHHMKKEICRLGGDPEKVWIIRFGVDTQKFSRGPKSEELMTKLTIHGSPTIISLRNLEPIYDIESLIMAVPSVLKEVPEAKFVIASRGSEEKRFKELVKSLAISDNVNFVGYIPNDELPQYLNSMDIYVSTSLSDAGISASTAEAMACGLPVIVTDVAENRNWVEDGVNGFVVPIRNPKALAERIIYLLQNKHMAKKFGETSRKIIDERNNYRKEMEKMGIIYEELVRRQK